MITLLEPKEQPLIAVISLSIRIVIFVSYHACTIAIIKLIINCNVLCMSFIGQVHRLSGRWMDWWHLIWASKLGASRP